MTTLEQEAEEYCERIDNTNSGVYSDDYDSFIAGVNSKFVKQQILQAQINAYQNCLYYIDENHNEKYVHQKIQELQQQLKELET